MKLVFSRKGFDSAAGRAPSPIIHGRPVSMPIPTTRRSVTRYADLGLGEVVERVTRGRIGRDHLCHEDPMHVGDACTFGQCGAAQSHLARAGVGVGDVFLFFGLFADEKSGERHHRIFGYLRVDALLDAADPVLRKLPRPHPHTLGEWNTNNTIYHGAGAVARHAPDDLRLTQPDGPLGHWRVPVWLHAKGLTYHGREERWGPPGLLHAAARGQEFVTDLGDDPAALAWVDAMLGLIRS